MSAAKRKPKRGRGGGGNGPLRPAEFWRAMPEPDPPAPITPNNDPTALIRSLGDPPLPGHSVAATQELAKVALRSANLATAVAAMAGILANPDAED